MGERTARLHAQRAREPTGLAWPGCPPRTHASLRCTRQEEEPPHTHALSSLPGGFGQVGAAPRELLSLSQAC